MIATHESDESFNEIADLARENERLRNRIFDMESLLSTVHDYLLPFVDVRDGDNGPKPNAAMQLVQAIDEVLESNIGAGRLLPGQSPADQGRCIPTSEPIRECDSPERDGHDALREPEAYRADEAECRARQFPARES